MNLQIKEQEVTLGVEAMISGEGLRAAIRVLRKYPDQKELVQTLKTKKRKEDLDFWMKVLMTFCGIAGLSIIIFLVIILKG